MADEEVASRTRGSLEFVESSVIQAIVPESTESDLEDRLRSFLGEYEDLQVLLHAVPMRSSLFFGRLQSPL